MIMKSIILTVPCSELWSRLFIWWDGKVNPCDYDYKSVFQNGIQMIYQ